MFVQSSYMTSGEKESQHKVTIKTLLLGRQSLHCFLYCFKEDKLASYLQSSLVICSTVLSIKYLLIVTSQICSLKFEENQISTYTSSRQGNRVSVKWPDAARLKRTAWKRCAKVFKEEQKERRLHTAEGVTYCSEHVDQCIRRYKAKIRRKRQKEQKQQHRLRDLCRDFQNSQMLSLQKHFP